MKTLFNYFLFFLFLIFPFTNIYATNFTCANPKPFTAVFSANIYGKLIIAGNTSLCKNDGGVCGDPGTTTNNNINMMNNDYDDINGTADSGATTLNSSAAYLDIPAGKTVLWAGLTWQGYMAGTWTDAQKEAGHTIKYKYDSDSSYHVDTNAQMNWVYFSSTRMYYQGFVNITNYVNAHKGGYYWVGDITTSEGQPAGGSFGAWSITVVYADTNEDFNNIAVYSGYQAFAGSGDINNAIDYASDHGCDTNNTGVGNKVSSTLTGFLTPKTGTVASNLVVFAGEGDIGLSGDWGSVTDINGTEHRLSNALNPIDNIMNATISNKGVTVTSGIPYYSPNTLGADIDIFDASSIMSNKQTTTDIKFSTNGDGYMPGLYGLQTKLYVPKFCYDYAYKQQGIYFTENNDGTKMPRLTGDVITNEPVELTVFIRNLVDSDIEVTDMNVSVLDINTSQTTYIRNTTKVAEIGDLIPQPISDSSLTVSDSFIKNIMIGTIKSNEHFYVYYSLNPIRADLNDSIDVTANYNLTIGGITIPYSLRLGDKMEICSTSNFKYAPAKGIFNIVHNDYYTWDGSNGNKYYNLPTQVTERTGNFKVISMDPDNLDDLKPTSTIVAVDMIDASAFHDTNASCMELASSISPRVWVTLENNTTSTPFNNTIVNANFYNTAKQNAAFRVSYNITNDGNGSLVEISGSNPYTIDNYDKLIGTLTSCPNSGMGTITTNCGNDGDSLTKAQLTSCMECLYGGNTKLVCSRDNFSIRPEAFMLNLDDQNQSSPTSKSRLTTNYSGAVGATAPVIDLAADYNYNLEINASNYLNNISSNGYTRSFNKLAYPNDPAEYKWEPRTGVTAGACNDEDNKSIDLRFVNGKLETNTSVPQVGEYRLHLLDTTWTAVDSDPTFMTHHNNSYFLQGLDCQQNSSATQTINSLSLNGCNISSSHLNPNNSYQYNDLNVTFHPYTFAINNTLKIGPSDILPPATLPFVYMANISTDENMSVHLHTTISAVGANSPTPLSNFVTGCYAKLLDISIDKSPTKDTNLSYEYRFHDFNATTGGSILTAYDVNASIAPGNVNDDANLTTLAGTFRKSLNGTINTQTNLNFKRAKNVAVNPEEITFISYKVHNSDTFNADLVTNKMADGNASLNNQKIIYYYGRTNAPRVTITCKTAPCQTHNDPNLANNPDHTRVYVYDEVYCYQTTNGNVCDMNLLPAGTTNSSDMRWWINLNEDQNTTAGANGIIGSVKEISANNVTELNQPMIYKYKYETVLKYNGNGNPAFPYFANMENNASDWLIYDESNAAATANKFRVDFVREAGWNGVHETNTTTKTNGAAKTNRRLMW